MADTTTSLQTSQSHTLHEVVTMMAANYLNSTDTTDNFNVYDNILRDTEGVLLAYLLELAKGNQCKLTRWLGLSRGTVRKKLKLYGLLD